ncbi:MAG: dipeptide epimerase [Alphaproteobacteria bacterium]|nr:dipeptide epimerase [Alphaproteobacteria bacterium]
MTGDRLTLHAEETVFPLAEVFTISRGSRTEARVVSVSVSDGVDTGRGECVPYARYGESVEGVIETIVSLRDVLDLDRDRLLQHLPAGAARNAVDCALWDLQAKRAGQRAYQLAGLAEPQPVQTAYTLSLDTPEAMQEKARAHADWPLLKIKLGGEGDLTRLEAVRRGAPDAAIIVDANEGWTVGTYQALAPELVRLGVKMVEQPLPAGEDDGLSGLERPLPVCADESCHDRASLAQLQGKYDMINIKLDKTGGLTEALALKRDATALGFDIMIGCMVASSLAMAPALLLAQGARFVDLDGPLLLASDRPDPLLYDAAGVHPSNPELWG